MCVCACVRVCVCVLAYFFECAIATEKVSTIMCESESKIMCESLLLCMCECFQLCKTDEPWLHQRRSRTVSFQRRMCPQDNVPATNPATTQSSLASHPKEST